MKAIGQREVNGQESERGQGQTDINCSKEVKFRERSHMKQYLCDGQREIKERIKRVRDVTTFGTG